MAADVSAGRRAAGVARTVPFALYAGTNRRVLGEETPEPEKGQGLAEDLSRTEEVSNARELTVNRYSISVSITNQLINF